MRCGQFDGLVELATICALCNDSALDYNEVCVHSLHNLPRFHFSGHVTFFLCPESHYFWLVVLAASVGHVPRT